MFGVSVAEALGALPAGIVDPMNSIVALVLLFCGSGIIAVLGVKGLKCSIAHDWGQAVGDFVGVGIGGSLIGFAKPLGTLLVGTALASTLTGVPAIDVIGSLVSLAVTNGPVFVGGMALYVRLRRRG